MVVMCKKEKPVDRPKLRSLGGLRTFVSRTEKEFKYRDYGRRRSDGLGMMCIVRWVAHHDGGATLWLTSPGNTRVVFDEALGNKIMVAPDSTIHEMDWAYYEKSGFTIVGDSEVK